MGVGVMFLALHDRGDDKLEQTAHFFLDNGRSLLELTEAVDNRRDEPEGVSFAWTQPVDLEEGALPADHLAPEDCFQPSEVATSLRWVKQLAANGDPDIESWWTEEYRHDQSSLPFSPERFDQSMRHDLEGFIEFCDAAERRGDVVVSILIA